MENQGLGGEEVTTARDTSTLRQYRSSTWGITRSISMREKLLLLKEDT